MRWVVAMVKFVVTGEVPLGVTGVAEQFARAGKPLQVKLTGELNPETELTATVMVALLPATTVAEVGVIAMLKFAPPPVSDTTCGLPAAESVIVKAPVLAPATVGVKTTLMMHDPPFPATVVPQLLVWLNAPEATIPVIDRLPVPEFDSVTICGALLVPTAWLPKVSAVGVMVRTGAAMPVPVSRMTCGLLGALSVSVSEPTLGPATVGVKVTAIVQFEGGVVTWSGAVQVLPLAAIANSPLATALVMVSGPVPVLVTVRVRGGLATPTPCEALKVRFAGDRVTMGNAPAVPVKSITCDTCEPPASVSVNVNLAVRSGGVAEVGLKITPTLQVPVGPTVDPQVLVWIVKSLLSAPAMAMPLMVSATLAPFVRVTVSAWLGCPTF